MQRDVADSLTTFCVHRKPQAPHIEDSCACPDTCKPCNLHILAEKLSWDNTYSDNNKLGVKFPGPFFFRELCRKTPIVGANMKEGSEDFHRKRSENHRK